MRVSCRLFEVGSEGGAPSERGKELFEGESSASVCFTAAFLFTQSCSAPIAVQFVAVPTSYQVHLSMGVTFDNDHISTIAFAFHLSGIEKSTNSD